MIRAIRPIRSIDRITSIGRIGDQQPHRITEAHRERLQNIIRRLIDKSRELRLIRAVDQEMAKAIIRVHDLDDGLVIVAHQTEAMVHDVGRDVAGVGREAVTSLRRVVGDEGLCLADGHRDLEELEGTVFPDLGVCGCCGVPFRVARVEAGGRKCRYRAQSRGDQRGVDVVWDTTAADAIGTVSPFSNDLISLRAR